MNGTVPGTVPGTVVVISSHVMRGSVGLRAGAFALEAMGHPVWSVPTVILPWHPGHWSHAGRPHRTPISPPDLKASLAALAASPFASEVRAVVSGYLADAEQAQAVADFVTAMRTCVPDLVYTLDPVMGDGGIGDGRLYVAEEVARAMADRLLPLADRVTPNAFELGWLTDRDEPRAALDALPTKEVLATSWPALRTDRIGTLLRAGDRVWLAEHPRVDGPPHGLGDLTACVFAGNALQSGPREALERTTATVFDTIARSAQLGADELAMEAALAALLRPRGRGEVREIRL